MKRTTDINALRLRPSLFTWGEITEIYDIAEYTIAAYHPWQVDDGHISEMQYHGWLNSEDVSQSWHSLDAALAGLITIKHAGHNSQAGYFFMKMIGVK